jgi:hypothetical protein
VTLRGCSRRIGWPIATLVAILAACGGGDDSGGTGGAPKGPVLSGEPDAGTFVFSADGGADAGELLIPCDPSNPSSCATGFTCYAQHTSASWWVDLYGTCTFDCTGQTYSLCDSLDGVCGCPVPEGQTTASCSEEAGVAMVCVPAVKPGTSPGANDGDGGCGTPGCSGGPGLDATAPTPVDDAGTD